MVAICEKAFRDILGCGDEIHLCNISRMQLDCDSPRAKAFQRIYYRLMCIDEQHREWGQPFYAAHPDKGTQRDLSN